MSIYGYLASNESGFNEGTTELTGVERKSSDLARSDHASYFISIILRHSLPPL
ncbi:hypothetical protein AGR2A_pb10088 [Agrobacterium genomosp. 2 str. CFBP 5494]|uniref:Uncharacterized protein n=1 Tax=Agrobacterium genomosp. 2 str. CFBP 5494 TaxID=1183436 RepID=A0A9W5F3S3_9HYPH|nr:hypothetical protein AGR2A_pb10088 [Agrobacterium genomosp. 2 str. CFBP 5494]